MNNLPTAGSTGLALARKEPIGLTTTMSAPSICFWDHQLVRRGSERLQKMGLDLETVRMEVEKLSRASGPETR